MAIPPQFIDELKDKIRISDVVGRKVALRRKGRDLWAPCPFHKEKTPSFKVDDDRGFYHCFGCGAHGGAIDFVMETENLEFREAVERLAALAGMRIPEETPDERARVERARGLYDVLEAAAVWFEGQLRMPGGRAALDYLLGRGLLENTVRAHRLGFAPDSRNALRAAMAREGINDDQLVAAGLVIRPDDPARPPYDRFRGRVMFPITDRQGRVVAFGGRILADGEPKYLNSPETDVFHKGRILYNLARARTAARTEGTVIVVEGYMDVIALAQAGLGNAVAPLGTALTEEQIAELWRLAPEPVLCFDGDQAGQRAAARAAERALAVLTPGRALRFAVLPGNEDPDSLVRTGGAGAMRAVLAAAVPLSEQIWRMGVAGRRLDTPEARGAAEKDLKELVFRITDQDLRGHYLRDIRDRLRAVGRPAAGGRWRPRSGQGRGGEPVNDPRLPEKAGAAARVDLGVLREEILLACLITHPALAEQIEERLGTLAFSGAALDKLRQEALNTLAGEPGLDSIALENHLRQSGFSDLMDRLLGEELYAHAFFARRAATDQTALEGWEETFDLYRKDLLKAEILAAQERLADEMTDEALERLMALQELERAVGDGNGAG